MRQMIKIEFQKLFGNVRFYYSIIGIMSGLLINTMEQLRFDHYSAMDNIFAITSTSAVFLICFALCIVGGGFSFCIEQRNHCVRYAVLRCGVQAYSAAKVIVSFIGGYLTSFLGCLFGECGIGMILFFRYRDMSKVFLGWVGIWNNFCYIAVFSLLCGVLSVLALLVTVVMPDFFVAMSMPILIYYMWLNITGWIHMPPFLNVIIIYFVNYDTYNPKEFCKDFGYAVLFSLCVIYMLWIMIQKGMKWRVENG